jgi:hypothetical protein
MSLATAELPTDPDGLRAFALACQGELKAAQMAVQVKALEIEPPKGRARVAPGSQPVVPSIARSRWPGHHPIGAVACLPSNAPKISPSQGAAFSSRSISARSDSLAMADSGAQALVCRSGIPQAPSPNASRSSISPLSVSRTRVSAPRRRLHVKTGRSSDRTPSQRPRMCVSIAIPTVNHTPIRVVYPIT